jgi:hypothetical protein
LVLIISCTFYFKQCFYELLTSYHTLKKIDVTLSDGLLEPAQDNRYLTAIKAIDPDAIEFYGRE